MNNSFYMYKKTSRYLIRLLSAGICFFTGLVIWSLIDGNWFSALLFGFFVVLNVIGYFYYSKVGAFNKMSLDYNGITIKSGTNKKIDFITWENVNDISKIRQTNKVLIKIDAYVSNDYLMSTTLDNSEKFTEIFNNLKIDSERFRDV